MTSIMEKLCKFYIGDINAPLCNFRERTESIVEPSKAEAVGEDGDGTKILINVFQLIRVG